mmetsp:Transcript_35015/g.56674  ORF Transcript_35015/g.56674 Transcript_35015/m.56674 type:complete len:104 (-) Transcript_35015:725-1036(-)
MYSRSVKRQTDWNPNEQLDENQGLWYVKICARDGISPVNTLGQNVTVPSQKKKEHRCRNSIRSLIAVTKQLHWEQKRPLRRFEMSARRNRYDVAQSAARSKMS